MSQQEILAAILADPKAHGFEFFTDTVRHEGRAFNEAQLVRHLDVDLLRATFGDALVLTNMDGTSRHVTNQRINRDAWWNALGETPSRKVTKDELQRLVVENMLGIVATRKTRVIEKIVEKIRFEALDGNVYDTREEAQAASMAWVVDQKQAAE